jgi:hypothetical protein
MQPEKTTEMSVKCWNLAMIDWKKSHPDRHIISIQSALTRLEYMYIFTEEIIP